MSPCPRPHYDPSPSPFLCSGFEALAPKGASDTDTTVVVTVVSVVVIVALVILMTIVLVLLFKYKCYKVWDGLCDSHVTVVTVM